MILWNTGTVSTAQYSKHSTVQYYIIAVYSKHVGSRHTCGRGVRMPSSCGVSPIPFTMRKGRGVDVTAHISVPACNDGELPGWRAVISWNDGRPKQQRSFGTCRPTIIEAADVLLNRHSHDIDPVEKRRVRAVLAVAHTQRCNRLPAICDGSVTDGAQQQAPSQCDGRGRGVSHVHQIYGLFGDGKPMSDLFMESSRLWRAVADTMGASYHLWNVADVEGLMKQSYGEFWAMYCGARYPIQRVDIARLAIIHRCGGLYVDLDVKPNRDWYAHTRLGLGQVLESDARPHLKGFLEMEVIIGERANPVFIDWLMHIRDEIARKPYHDPDSFWYTAKVRYVYHTMGPLSLRRFLRLPANANVVADLTYVTMNDFQDCDTLTARRRARLDVISHESNSYFTKEQSIFVPVGSGDSPLPSCASRKRIRAKSPSARRAVRRVADDHGPLVVTFDQGTQTEATALTAAEREELQVLREATQDGLTAKQHMVDLMRFFKKFRKSTALRSLLQDMPPDLKKWVVESFLRS